MENKDRKTILEIRHLDVKFNVRGRYLNAIRDISLEIKDGESLAIVGESGSGKSVFTKTFAGMLDSNGFISHGKIFFYDEDLEKTTAAPTKRNKEIEEKVFNSLNEYSYLEKISEYLVKMIKTEEDYKHTISLTEEEEESFEKRLKKLNDDYTDTMNLSLALNPKDPEQRKQIASCHQKMKELAAGKKALIVEKNELSKKRKADAIAQGLDVKAKQIVEEAKKSREDALVKAKAEGLSEEIIHRNEIAAKEVVLALARFPFFTQEKCLRKLLKNFKSFMERGKDITIRQQIDKIYGDVTFRTIYVETLEDGTYVGKTLVDCARVKFTKDWQKIRGCKIATVFQDPMTSLNPILTIGKQITTVIIKHQKCTPAEAKERAIDMMRKVGIPDPEHRFNDYPFQYSGGMRQRIVIAIALSCQPKILICDEPTTALDVTIQAQIIKLIRDLGKELGFTTVYITHDLGVVANVAERVAVIYGGQIIEVGTVEEIFYDPKHPYTWALLSSLPQLSQRQGELFSINGTPPSLYNKIIGDAFAPRNKYALAIDYVKEPPMFKVSETHYAKTWLLDPRSPKVEKPEIIQNLHEKMVKIYGDGDVNKQREGD